MDKSPSERGKFTMPYVTPGFGVDASALAMLQTHQKSRFSPGGVFHLSELMPSGALRGCIPRQELGVRKWSSATTTTHWASSDTFSGAGSLEARKVPAPQVNSLSASAVGHGAPQNGKDFEEALNNELHRVVRELRNGTRSEASVLSAYLCGNSGSKRGITADAANDQKATSARNAASGPRRKDEGVEDLVQGITGARRQSNGAIQLHMTLLVAGFVIGPCGVSIRDIINKTGAKISSWTKESGSSEARMARVFVIKGSATEITHALRIVLAAVCRYKELAEGKFAGQRVDSMQVVKGVEFLYRPPPKERVPYAASIDTIAKKTMMTPRCFYPSAVGALCY